MNDTYPHPFGADRRRGPFRAGERVQLTDTKGRKYTTMLRHGGFFQSQRGNFRHDDLIGQPEGTVFTAENGHRLQAMRPLISDYVLSMPRGATVVYPKDAGQIVHQADIFPGARVVEAGLGSGALAISLLAAVGMEGHLTSVERRAEFAEIAQANVESWYGPQLPPWDVRLGDLDQVLREMEPQSVDRVVLDMLAPWENIDSAAHALIDGGVILAYVATTTQMSRFVETLRESLCFTEPEANETMLRTWHLDGLAVRPDHRMVAHTGFLVVARRIARGSEPLVPKRRPAPLAHNEALDWEESELAERPIAAKKLRKVRRDVATRADLEASGVSGEGAASAQIREKIAAELAKRDAARYAQRKARRDAAREAFNPSDNLEAVAQDAAQERTI
ncbi:tRNA (adenine-N1)-methyltransferase [Arcanobacterium hippocoleae]|uniref:tRNA (Adenine57-N1/adenine58-N1)-methyltransferase n=1 Tax=Arcanobacterium hippocoleae TaxID=149017 RepID=A0ABU1T1U1_9ACTO|nr:tRNA (adenine-N1)-methyltransferase [Arcanobacterium hippocoleae]MDR6938820.1 tRNA (adenine57-N1/adenine58-N1)-methyltransferase [Arcanobacterium hippocoleae]